MGGLSEESKKKKRYLQKQRCKKKQHKILDAFNYCSPSSCSLTDTAESTASETTHSDYSATEEVVGLHVDVLEMETDDQLSSETNVEECSFYGTFSNAVAD